MIAPDAQDERKGLGSISRSWRRVARLTASCAMLKKSDRPPGKEHPAAGHHTRRRQLSNGVPAAVGKTEATTAGVTMENYVLVGLIALTTGVSTGR